MRPGPGQGRPCGSRKLSETCETAAVPSGSPGPSLGREGGNLLGRKMTGCSIRELCPSRPYNFNKIATNKH